MKRLKGIVVNMLSPIQSDGSLDKDSVDKMLTFYRKNKIGGVWALGSAGEDINLSNQFKVDFAKHLSKTYHDGLPIIIGLGNMSFSEIKNFIDLNKDNSFDAYHILLYDQKLSDIQAEKYIIKIAEVSDKPLWLYNNPKRGKYLGMDTIEKLSKHKNIVGIKVGGYDLTVLTKSILLENDNFQVMAAGGGQLYQALSLGYKCHSTSDANCFPRLLNNIYYEYEKGNISYSKELQFEFLKIMKEFPSYVYLNGEKSAEEKFICSTKGLCNEYVNPLYTTLDKSSKEKIINVIKKYNL